MDIKNVSYRKDGRFVKRKVIKGIQIVAYGRSLREVSHNFSEKMKEYMQQIKIGYSNLTKQPTFLEWWNKWYKEDKEPYIKPATIKEIVNIFKRLEPLYSIELIKLNKDTIVKFLNTFGETRIKEKVYLYLRACLKHAVNHNVIKTNPFALIKAPIKRRAHKKAFSYEEQVKIINNLRDKKLFPIILVYLCTGLRKNEFDFKEIEKHIDFENFILKAENLKGRGLDKRYKNIQITKELCSLIMSNLDIIHDYDSEKAYEEFSKFLKKLNISGSIVTCRHTYATNSMYLGNPDFFISKNMGHSTSQITKDNYMDIDYHLSKDKIIKLYNNLFYKFE